MQNGAIILFWLYFVKENAVCVRLIRADQILKFFHLLKIFSYILEKCDIVDITKAKGGSPLAYQAVFKRYETKYMITRAQKQKLLEAMAPYMALDKYGRTTIRNIYFDTDNYRLIRRSIEKPFYKEKLRIRSYRQATPDSPVFVELKKKYDGIVYKRRLSMTEQQAIDWICRGGNPPEDNQIAREINYFLRFYRGLKPKVFLSYAREAYYSLDGSDFRVTFDDEIRCRRTDLSLESDPSGDILLPEDKVLMEIKCSGGIPLWMVQTMTEERIFRTPFSKYGTAYQNIIFPERKGDIQYA